MGVIERISGYLSAATNGFGTIVVLPAMTLIVSVDVFLRYVLNAPFVWGQEVTGLMLLMFVFLCQPRCWETRHHIRMDVVFNALGVRGKALVEALSCVCGAVFFGAMGIQAVRDIPYMIRTNEVTDELRMLVWPFTALMAFCCWLLVAQLVLGFIGSIRRLWAAGRA